MEQKLRNELEEIFRDPILAFINEDSVKRMNEVVRDVYPNATKGEICDILSEFWESDDTPETLYNKLIQQKTNRL